MNTMQWIKEALNKMSKLHLEKILELAQSLQDYSAEKITDTPLEELLPFLQILEETARDEKMDAEPAVSKKSPGASPVIRDFHRQLTVKMEMEQAQKILAASKPWPWLRNYYFYKDYHSLITREQEMAGFAPYERLAYIGGGALPLSLILYQQLFGIRGVSIEKDPELAAISRKVLQKLDLSSHIHVIPGDETLLAEIEFEGFIVDAQAQPRKRVFTHLHASAPAEAKIVCRAYAGLLNSQLSPEDVSGFQAMDQCLFSGKVNLSSVLVRKV
ncbi:hypothetical protein FGU46_09410 [Methanobacterium sp. CWC-01]|nr:hypothetical protein FGU46_09410 [Methanobacterium sp. CWC-01]